MPDKTCFVSDKIPQELSDVKFGHSASDNALYEILTNCDAPFCIGLYGSWGTGKTGIVLRTIAMIKTQARDKLLPFYFDAWKFSGDSLRRQLLISLDNDLNSGKSNLRNSLYIDMPETVTVKPTGISNIGWVLIFSAVAFLSAALYLAFVKPELAYGWTASSFTAAIIAFLSFILKGVDYSYSATRKIVDVEKPKSPERFAKCFWELLKSISIKHPKKRLVLFFDNLDRCSHEVVKESLLAISTYLDSGNCISVIACDKDVLKSCFCASKEINEENKKRLDEDTDPIYHPRIDDGSNFLDKIVDTSITIPPLVMEGIEEFALGKLKESVFRDMDFIEELAIIITQACIDNPRRVIRLINLFVAHWFLVQNYEAQGIAPKKSVTGKFPSYACFLILRELDQDRLVDFALHGQPYDASSTFPGRYTAFLHQVSNHYEISDFKLFLELTNRKFGTEYHGFLRFGLESKKIHDLLTKPQKEVDPQAKEVIKNISETLREYTDDTRAYHRRAYIPFIVGNGIRLIKRFSDKVLRDETIPFWKEITNPRAHAHLEHHIDGLLELAQRIGDPDRVKPFLSRVLEGRRDSDWLFNENVLKCEPLMDEAQRTIIQEQLLAKYKGKDIIFKSMVEKGTEIPISLIHAEIPDDLIENLDFEERKVIDGKEWKFYEKIKWAGTQDKMGLPKLRAAYSWIKLQTTDAFNYGIPLLHSCLDELKKIPGLRRLDDFTKAVEILFEYYEARGIPIESVEPIGRIMLIDKGTAPIESFFEDYAESFAGDIGAFFKAFCKPALQDGVNIHTVRRFAVFVLAGGASIVSTENLNLCYEELYRDDKESFVEDIVKDFLSDVVNADTVLTWLNTHPDFDNELELKISVFIEQLRIESERDDGDDKLTNLFFQKLKECIEGQVDRVPQTFQTSLTHIISAFAEHDRSVLWNWVTSFRDARILSEESFQTVIELVTSKILRNADIYGFGSGVYAFLNREHKAISSGRWEELIKTFLRRLQSDTVNDQRVACFGLLSLIGGTKDENRVKSQIKQTLQAIKASDIIDEFSEYLDVHREDS